VTARSIVQAALLVALASRAEAAGPDPHLFDGLRWRLVGPFRGGRTVTATGVPGAPERFYFGSVGGGVWRSDNAGRTWTPIFDGQPIASIGAIAVAPSDPKVIYVGTGEADMRSDITYGNGVYKSSDGGATWTHVGLADTRQIGQVVVDPHDPAVVFVAALGHAYGPNKERGLFRSTDGGATWKNVLFKDDDTGAIDVAFAPDDAKIMLACLWQTRRPPWNVYAPSNGPGSGLWRSVDGGTTWTQLTASLPAEKVGRIRVAFAPSDPKRAYALFDAKEGGLFRSDDHGATWRRVGSDRRIWERGWYFAGLTVDPANADVVYACDVALYRSTDGGSSFLPFKGAPGGDDYHRLWIDPAHSRRMILASDQGAAVTVDGGATWSSWYNQPTAQFYHVATDDRFPYWIYGAQQDSGAAATPSRTDYRTITQRDWNEISAGGESGYLIPDPKDASTVWGGTVGRFDWRTLQDQNLDPTLAHPGTWRGEWTLPLAISPLRPDQIWFGRQMLFRSTDGGRKWDKASPDLTRDNPAVPSTLDAATAEDSDVKEPRRGVIYAIAPSPVKSGRIWCGTDDGLVWRSDDDGGAWRDVTPKDLTPWSKVGIIEASRFDADTAYAAIDRHRIDDLRATILRTRDGGNTWASISSGIPDGSFVNVVREDPVRRGLLYAGTETGVFVSFDDGGHWQPLQTNLPHCSIRDIDVRHGDLVVATHGRSFWALDDLSPLRQVDTLSAAAEIALVAPRTAVRLHAAPFQGSPEPKDEPMAENPPAGAVIDYFVAREGASPLVLEIANGSGAVVRRYSSDDPPPHPPDLQRLRTTPDWVASAAPLSAAVGLHRLVWDLHDGAPPQLGPAGRGSRPASGPWSPPGRYSVRLTRGSASATQTLTVVKDPRLPASVADADLVAQYEAARSVQAERVRVAEARRRAADLRKRVAAAREAAGEAGAPGLDRALADVDRAAGPAEGGFGEGVAEPEGESPTSLRRLADSLAELQSAIESADAAPTHDAISGLAYRRTQVAAGLADWEKVASAASTLEGVRELQKK
jgi:photosystem II stability/assembly factor-like uncharacterized protein